MKKLIAVLFLVSLILTACSVNADIKSDPTMVSSTFESAIEADLAYSEMINQQFDKLVEHWNGSYPDYYCGCYIDNERGVVKVPDLDPADYPAVVPGLPEGAYHIYDYQFFYRNLEENVKKRIDSFLSTAK